MSAETAYHGEKGAYFAASATDNAYNAYTDRPAMLKLAGGGVHTGAAGRAAPFKKARAGHRHLTGGGITVTGQQAHAVGSYERNQSMVRHRPGRVSRSPVSDQITI
jgi:hypothetical protein